MSSSVVVIGAGLSGLYAARELQAAGLEVTVVDARDRTGGRLRAHVLPSGRKVDGGGEFSGPALKELYDLAIELGMHWEPLHYDPAHAAVRIHRGERLVEFEPFAADPLGGEQIVAIEEEIEALGQHLDLAYPARSEEQIALDQLTIAQWLDQHTLTPTARAYFDMEARSLGGAENVSMLFLVWQIARFGGWANYGEISGGHFTESASYLTDRLAEIVGAENIRLSTFVESVTYDDSHVQLVLSNGEQLHADAVIVATGGAPQISFTPELPETHSALSAGWISNHGSKIFFEYDKPFWREENLSGFVMSDGEFALVLDTGDATGPGLLCVLSIDADAQGDISDDELTARALAHVVFALGPRAAQPTGTLASNWYGDDLSAGCGNALRPGALTAARDAIEQPVGRVFWAGADRGGRGDYMQGAVTNAQRAVAQILATVAH